MPREADPYVVGSAIEQAMALPTFNSADTAATIMQLGVAPDVAHSGVVAHLSAAAKYAEIQAKVDASTAANRFISLDLETTGLDPRRHVPWEVGYVVFDVDWTERTWRLVDSTGFFVTVTRARLEAADLVALRIGKFWERYDRELAVTPGEAAERLVRACADPPGGIIQLLGACPWFDDEFIRAWVLWPNGLERPWHYHLVDVETLANGYLAGADIGLDENPVRHELSARRLFSSFGVRTDRQDAHTASGDAWANVAVFEALYGLRKVAQ